MSSLTTHQHKSNRFKLYVWGTVYLSLCAVSLGYIAGMWGMTAMSVYGVIMLVAGGLFFELYRRSGQPTIQQFVQQEVVSETVRQETSRDIPKDDVSEEISQFRKYVDVANMTDSSNDDEVQTESKIPQPEKPDIEQDAFYSDAVMEELIYTAIDRESVDVFMQPVVALPQRRVVMMEVFARLRAGNGKSLSAQQYMGLAREKNLQVKLDNILLRQTLKAVHKDIARGVERSYMLNMEEMTLKDIDFMEDLFGLLRAEEEMASRLIFEIKQSILSEMSVQNLSVLSSLAKLGCRVSMDQVDDPHLDRAFMREIGVRFIKVSGERLKTFSETDEGVTVMRRIKVALAEDGVSIISDKVEDERTVCEVLDLEIDYGQGYLFGKPDRETVYDRTSRKTA